MIRLRNLFIAGLLVVVPIFLTWWVLQLLFGFMDGFSQPLLELYIGREIPGAGAVLTTLMVLILGYLSTLFVGQLRLDFTGELTGGSIPNQRGWLVRTKATGSLVVVIDAKGILTATSTGGAEEAAAGVDTVGACRAGNVALDTRSGSRRLRRKHGSAARQGPTCYCGGRNT